MDAECGSEPAHGPGIEEGGRTKKSGGCRPEEPQGPSGKTRRRATARSHSSGEYMILAVIHSALCQFFMLWLQTGASPRGVKASVLRRCFNK